MVYGVLVLHIYGQVLQICGFMSTHLRLTATDLRWHPQASAILLQICGHLSTGLCFATNLRFKLISSFLLQICGYSVSSDRFMRARPRTPVITARVRPTQSSFPYSPMRPKPTTIIAVTIKLRMKIQGSREKQSVDKLPLNEYNHGEQHAREFKV